MEGALAESIREYRRRAGLTQDALANRAGVSVRTIRAIETGRQGNPQLLTVCLLADALTLPVAERDQLLAAAVGSGGPAPGVLPRQLPAEPHHFVGRTGELTQIDAACDGQPVCLVGTGGIGKTWLALRWAYKNLDRFPDGQLFVNMHGFDPTCDPISPETVMRGFLHSLGVDLATSPADLDGQVGLYRSLVAGKRLLIVVDNAPDAASLVPLLPGSPSCAVVVTSRVWLSELVAQHGAQQMIMPLLPANEARALLVERLGTATLTAEPLAAEGLLTSCAGLPLALSIVAGQVRSGRQAALTTLAAEIRNVGLSLLDDDSPSVSAALSCSFRALPPEHLRMLTLLSVAPGPSISLHAAAALADVPLGRARFLIRALERVSLLDQQADSRYHMHDLIRHYASRYAESVSDADRLTAVRRLVDFSVRTAYLGDRLLSPNRPPITSAPSLATAHLRLADSAAALAWFGDEHVCLLTLQQVALDHDWNEAAWQLAWSLNRFHYRSGNLAADITVTRTAVIAAERLGDPDALVATHRLLGLALARAGDDDEGLAYLGRALTLAEVSDDRVQLAGLHHALTLVRGLRDENEEAARHAGAALALYRESGLKEQEAEALNSVGWYAARCGDYGRAREHCEAALLLHRRSGDVASEAIVLDSLGYIAQHTGRLTEAVEHYQNALTLLAIVGDAFQQVGTHESLGVTYFALERFDAATSTWQKALDACRAQGRIGDVARIQARLDALNI